MSWICCLSEESLVLHYCFVLLDFFPPYLPSSLISLSLLLLIFLVAYFLIKFAGENLELSLAKCKEYELILYLEASKLLIFLTCYENDEIN